MDCQWGEWTEQPCTATCGVFAIKRKTRIKAQEAVRGGVDCQGESVKLESCNHQKCPGRINRYDVFLYQLTNIIMMRCNSSFANYYITNLLQRGVMIVLHYVRYGRRKSGFPNGALESTNQKMQRDILAGLH